MNNFSYFRERDKLVFRLEVSYFLKYLNSICIGVGKYLLFYIIL